MRKHLFLFCLLALIGLISSCSNEEDAALSRSGDNQVTFTLNPEGSINTRAEISRPIIPAGFQLRYILEVYNANSKALIQGSRQSLTTDKANEEVSFTVTLPKGVPYTCIFWADLIKTEGTNDYAYDTTDLQAINMTAQATASDVTYEALNAFYGSAAIATDGSTPSTSILLKHAVAQVNIKVVEPLSDVAKISCEYDNFVNQFNVLTGEYKQIESGATKSTYTNNIPSTTGATKANPITLQTIYLFAATEGTMLNSATIKTYNSSNGVEKTVEVPNVTVKRNYRTNLIGDLNGMGTIVFKLSCDNGFLTPDMDYSTFTADPQVGDYFYANGTWSSTLIDNSANPCIGVIFKIGKDKNDAEEYKAKNGKSSLGTIHGYVKPKPYSVQRLTYITWSGTSTTVGTSTDKTDWKGYSNTLKIKETAQNDIATYPILKTLLDHENGYKAPDNSSGWFLPSIGQLEHLANSGILGDLSDQNYNYYYWSSTEVNAQNAYIYGYNGIESKLKTYSGDSYAKHSFTAIFPILVF